MKEVGEERGLSGIEKEPLYSKSIFFFLLSVQ